MATATQLFTSSNIEVIQVISEPLKVAKATAADIISKGDLINNASAAYTAQTADVPMDNVTFWGVSLTDSPGADQENSPLIHVAYHCICRVKLAGTVLPGYSLIAAAGPTIANLKLGIRAEYTFSNAAANGICWALESGVSGDYIRVLFNTIALGGIYTQTAWQPPTT